MTYIQTGHANEGRSRYRRSLCRLATPFLAAVFVMSTLVGCGAPIRVFVHPEADMEFYTNVGVIPFQSMAADRFAGEKLSIHFMTALLASNKFNVMDYGVFVNQVTRTVGSRNFVEGLSLEELKKIGEAAGVEGVFYGNVMQYEMVASASGSFPTISVEARLVDTATGTVVWQATISERGGPKTPIIGIGETHTLGELAQKICRKLVSRIE